VSVTTRLFDADGTDDEVQLDSSVIKSLGDRQLLWVDIHGEDEAELRGLAEDLDLSRQSLRNLSNPIGRPHFDVADGYFEMNVAPLDEDENPLSLDIIAGSNWVATIHRERIPFIDEFRERLASDTQLGLLTAESFVAALLDWHVGTYFASVDDMERSVDDLDERALRESDRDEALEDMIKMRRRIGRIRRTLTPHREVFAALARPDFQTVASSESAAHFRALVARLEGAISSVENTRELLIGSFDIFMSTTGQRTNDVMRLLTIISVILLPAVVLAGVMGMNFQLPIFQDLTMFWVVMGAMILIAVVVLVVARRQHWL
jgi:magnesium/cobalt transport protein CorA